MNSPKRDIISLLGLFSLGMWFCFMWLNHMLPGQSEQFTGIEYILRLLLVFPVLAFAFVSGMVCLTLARKEWQGLDRGERIVATMSSLVTLGMLLWCLIDVTIPTYRKFLR